MGGVDLDGIEPGPHGAFRSRDKRRLRLRDAGARHRLGHDGLGVAFLDDVRKGRGRDRRLSGDVDPRVPAAVAELDRGLGAGRMDGVGETREPGEEPVVVDAELELAMLPGFLRRRHFDGDQAHAALGAGTIVGNGGIRDETLRVGLAGRHRGHDHAVLDCKRADPPGLQQSRKRHASVSGPAFSRSRGRP